jgi:hypothetical protein
MANTNGNDEISIEAETMHDQAAAKALAIKELMREHKREVEGLLVEQDEEWFNDDPFVVISMENMAAEQQKKGEPKVYGAQNELHEFGVYRDDWWVGTSYAMMAMLYVLLFIFIIVVVWQFMYFSYQVRFFLALVAMFYILTTSSVPAGACRCVGDWRDLRRACCPALPSRYSRA